MFELKRNRDGHERERRARDEREAAQIALARRFDGEQLAQETGEDGAFDQRHGANRPTEASRFERRARAEEGHHARGDRGEVRTTAR